MSGVRTWIVFFFALVIFIQPIQAQWINNEDLVDYKIKHDLAAFSEHAFTYAYEKGLYDGLVQSFSSKEEIDRFFDGTWKVQYMCETNRLDSTYDEVECLRSYLDIDVIYHRQNLWFASSTKTATVGQYKFTPDYFSKEFEVQIRLPISFGFLDKIISPDEEDLFTIAEKGKLIFDGKACATSFRIEGTIKAIKGFVQKKIEGRCEMIKDDGRLVCVGNTVPPSGKTYINVYQRPHTSEPISIIPPGGCDFSPKR